MNEDEAELERVSAAIALLREHGYHVVGPWAAPTPPRLTAVDRLYAPQNFPWVKDKPRGRKRHVRIG